MRALTLALGVALAGCKSISHAPIVVGGDAVRGRKAIERYGCGGCHTIPGVSGARGHVGPQLDDLAGRLYIAGVVRNEPNALVRWIIDPPSVDSQTAMPALGVTLRDARDIAEYLYRLRAR